MTVQYISLPDGSYAEVPDTMSDADIEAMVAKEFPENWRAARGAKETVEEMSPTERFGAGILKTGADIANFGRGLYNRAADAIDPQGRYEAQLVEEKDSEPFNKALTDTWSGWGGNVAGDIAATVLPGAGAANLVRWGATKIPAVVNAYRALPQVGNALIPKMAKASGMGAAAGATGETMLNRDASTGGAIGAGVGLAFPALAQAGRVATHLWQNFRGGAPGAAIDEARFIFRRNRPEAIAALRQPHPVEGGQMTAGMSAPADGSIPQLSALEAGARSRPNAGRFGEADARNARAMNDALAPEADAGRGGINPETGAPTPSTVEALRRQATGPVYDDSMADLVPVTDDLADYLGREGVRSHVRAGLAKWGRDFSTNRLHGEPTPPPGRFNAEGVRTHYSISELDAVKKMLQNQTSEEAQFVRNEVVGAMRRASPTYNTAEEGYRLMSGPVNQAKIAGAVQDTLNSPAAAGQIAPEQVVKALRDVDNIRPKSGTPDYIRTYDEAYQGNPEGLQRLRQVGRAAEMKSNANAASGDQGVIPDYKSLLQNAVEDTPHVMTRSVTALRSLARSITGRSQKRVTAVIDRAAANSPELARLLEAVPPSQRAHWVKAAGRYLENNIPLGAVVAPLVTQLRKTQE